MKKLIINADDFGLCESVDRGIIECLQTGIVSDLSVMVHQERIEPAMRRLKNLGIHSVGLHINLTLGKSILGVPSNLTEPDGKYNGLGKQVKKIIALQVPTAEIEQEIQSQMDILLDSGFEITHVDSHQNIHLLPFILNPLREVLARYEMDPNIRMPGERPKDAFKYTRSNMKRALVLRTLSIVGSAWTRYRSPVSSIGSDLYNNTCIEKAFLAALQVARQIPAGIIEFPVHPGFDSIQLNGYDSYGIQRERELRFLKRCDIKIDDCFELTAFGTADWRKA